MSLDLLPIDLPWPPHLDLLPPADLPRHAEPPPFVSLPSRNSGAARSGGPAIPTPAPPPPGERDLTLADLTVGRRDLSWDQNPGWPAAVDWTAIARAARGHSPRHARRFSPRTFVWSGAGVIAAVLLTILITTISELLH